MKILETQIPDLTQLIPTIFEDSRGFFFESFRASVLNDYLSEEINFVQDNESYSKYGVLRGLHFQCNPAPQAKLVRVVYGKILDVAVDLRKNSRTFLKHQSFELSQENKHQLFIPRGFAHGFITLSKEAVVQYKVDNYYQKEYDSGITHADPSLGINWILPDSEIKLSTKDSQLTTIDKIQLF